MGIDFTDYAFLKDAEKRYPVRVALWKRTQGSRLALLPNLNTADPRWKPLLRDVRMRRALSLAIDREEINKAVFYGLGKESADTVLPESPLYKPEYAQAWVARDPDQANKLLDELGLTGRDDDGIRLLGDGRSAQMVVETAGESTLETDVLELVTDHWRQVGIALFIRTSQRDVFRSRAMAGEIMMSMWSGIDNGVPTADMNPGALAPTMTISCNGRCGAPIINPTARSASSPTWRKPPSWSSWSSNGAARPCMTNAQQCGPRCSASTPSRCFRSASSTRTQQPVLCAARMKNLPGDALYGFEPTSYFGVYMPDTFWLDNRRLEACSVTSSGASR